MSLEVKLRPNPVEQDCLVHVGVVGDDIVPGEEFISCVEGLGICTLHAMARHGVSHLDYTANLATGLYKVQVYRATLVQHPTSLEPHERCGELLAEALLTVIPSAHAEIEAKEEAWIS